LVVPARRNRLGRALGRTRDLCAPPFAACVCAALLAACSGSGAAAPTAQLAGDTPTPVPSPQITGGRPPAAAVETVRQFWKVVGEGRLTEAQRSLVAPGSDILEWSGDDIAAARVVRVVPHSVSRSPVENASVEFAVDVWIDPSRAGAGVWGGPGEHRLFESLVRMSDGTWRMYESGTGP
jgi:hypothetical protein